MKKILVGFSIVFMLLAFSYKEENKLRRESFGIFTEPYKIDDTHTRLTYDLVDGDYIHNYTVSWKVVWYHPYYGVLFEPTPTINIATLKVIPSAYRIQKVHTHPPGYKFLYMEVVNGPYPLIN